MSRLVTLGRLFSYYTADSCSSNPAIGSRAWRDATSISLFYLIDFSCIRVIFCVAAIFIHEIFQFFYGIFKFML